MESEIGGKKQVEIENLINQSKMFFNKQQQEKKSILFMKNIAYLNA